MLVREGATAAPANAPFAHLPVAASFTVTSTTVTDGTARPPEQHPSGLHDEREGHIPTAVLGRRPGRHRALCRHRLRP